MMTNSPDISDDIESQFDEERVDGVFNDTPSTTPQSGARYTRGKMLFNVGSAAVLVACVVGVTVAVATSNSSKQSSSSSPDLGMGSDSNSENQGGIWLNSTSDPFAESGVTPEWMGEDAVLIEPVTLTDVPTAKPTSPPTAMDRSGAPTVKPTSLPVPSPTFSPIVATERACEALNITDGTMNQWVPISDDILGEAAFDFSGAALDMSADGSIIAVGAAMNDGGGDKAGHVRIFRYTAEDGYIQMGSDIDGERDLDWFGSAVALSASGYRLAVGGRWSDGQAEAMEDVGHARIYDYSEDSDSWIQVGADIEGSGEGDSMGRSISLSADGSRLAVGASHSDKDANNTDVGHVELFDLVDDAWVSIGNIQGDDAGDFSGSAVSLSEDGSHVAIGAFGHDAISFSKDVGQVRVFKYDKSTKAWTKIGQDLHGSARGQWAGATVSLNRDGTRVAFGVPGESGSFLPGFARVYELQSDSWVQLGTADLKGGYDISLSSDGSRIAVGDYRGFNNGINSGHVNIYEFSTATASWDTIGQELNGNPQEMSGTTVKLSADGTRVALSAPANGDWVVGQQVGATRVFDLC